MSSNDDELDSKGLEFYKTFQKILKSAQTAQVYKNQVISIKQSHKCPEGKTTVSKKNETISPESAILSLCVRLCILLGLPKSIGLIYGAIFVSPKPLEAGQICRKLRISRGSVSQGLRFLKELGAIRSEGMKGGRSEHYMAEGHLGGAIESFLLKKMFPAMEEIGHEIRHLEKIIQQGGAESLSTQLEALCRWHSHGKLLFPMITGFIKTIPLLSQK